MKLLSETAQVGLSSLRPPPEAAEPAVLEEIDEDGCDGYKDEDETIKNSYVTSGCYTLIFDRLFQSHIHLAYYLS